MTLTSDQVALLKAYYVTGDVTFRELAECSEMVCGLEVSEDAIKWHSKRDVDGSWPKARSQVRHKEEGASTSFDMDGDVLRVIYETLVSPIVVVCGECGAATEMGQLGANEKAALAGVYVRLRQMRPRGRPPAASGGDEEAALSKFEILRMIEDGAESQQAAS